MKNKLVLIIVGAIIVGGYMFFSNSSNPQKIENLGQKESSSSQVKSDSCSGITTVAQTEGPYYKLGSPERTNISQGVSGEPLTITGFVFDKDCNPIVNAWLDFWQADSAGNYDNDGYILRGHLFTDESGKYTVKTIVPSEYGGRPAHIHVKIREGDGPILTSQLYFPNASQNQTDSIFDGSLIMEMSEDRNGKVGTFNFVLP